ncbi:hypothetical protein PsYK624_154410 [Phanerochaete sordida]|uniref:Uncharacterized protein n=1 Tax=Phanerochaete sordida TaxID=48140 RepID=A0A9P3LMB7_9APHY|nr:hypothetical protein PsYK624_154410 [Phanerochaete sordida]
MYATTWGKLPKGTAADGTHLVAVGQVLAYARLGSALGALVRRIATAASTRACVTHRALRVEYHYAVGWNLYHQRAIS